MSQLISPVLTPRIPSLSAAAITKLYPPQSRATDIVRSHLVATFGTELTYRIVLVCAPAGYGKSTAVAQWLQRTAIPTAWVTLDHGDAKPQPFFSLIVAAMQLIDPEFVSATAALVRDQRGVRVDAIVRQLSEDCSVANRPFALVLDDYHTVDDPDTHRAMNTLLQNAPPMMRLTLISRTLPPLALSRLMAAGELTLVEERDLAFTTAEAMDFYRDQLELELTSDEIEAIHARTEGWAAGLHLAGIALRNRSREGVQRFAADVGLARPGDQYLWDEVIQGLPPKVRTFLVQTSILDRFTVELSNAATGRSDGDAMIQRCEHDHLFLVPLDERGLWFRYHHLFADVLRERLARTTTEQERDDLHLRASLWLEDHAFVDEAAKHAIAGHAWVRAVRLLEESCAEFYDHDYIAALRARIEHLPDEIFARSPRLAFWLAWALGRSGRWDDGLRPLVIAERVWLEADDRAGRGLVQLWHMARAIYMLDNQTAIMLANRALVLLPPTEPTARVMALMSRGMGHLYSGETQLAEKAFVDVRTEIDRSGQDWFHPFEMAYSATALAQRGSLAESAVLCRAVVRAAGEHPREIWVQPALRQLGDVYYEWGQLDEAWACYQRGIELADQTQALHWRSRLKFGLARTAWALGRTRDAHAQIELALNRANRIGNAQDARAALAWQARFWVESNMLEQARVWAAGAELDENVPPSFEQQVGFFALARLNIADERPELALTILAGLRDLAVATGRHGDLPEIETTSTLAHIAAGDHAAAMRSLDSALQVAETGGYRQVFLSERVILAPLLRQLATRGDRHAFAADLVATIDGGRSTEHGDANGVLSAREIEVLRLVATGLPNGAIGSQLYIEERTVKKHMSNILAKLHASNRTEAVNKALQSGLI